MPVSFVVVKSAQALSAVSIIPLAALEERAVPLVAEFTERVQPVTEVTMGFSPSLSSKVSKSPLVITRSSSSVSSVSVVESELSVEEELSSVQEAKAAIVDVLINNDKKSARSFFLRELVFVFIQPPFSVCFTCWGYSAFASVQNTTLYYFNTKSIY